MLKKAGVLGMVVLWCGMAFAANDSGSVIHKNAWAVGYDEGLAGKYFIDNKISANLSLGYTVKGGDAPYVQPINTLQIKIGGQYLLREYKKVRVNAFLDMAGMMKQGQVAYQTKVGPNKTFNQWIASFRLGLAPELFIFDHVSLTYKFGLVLTSFGTTYKLNADESSTERVKDNHAQFGVYGYQSDSPFMLLHNISFFVYF
jgi:hypothetical protein